MGAISTATIFFTILWIVVALVLGEIVAARTQDIKERRANKQYPI